MSQPYLVLPFREAPEQGYKAAEPDFLVHAHWLSRKFTTPEDVQSCLWQCWDIIGGHGSHVSLHSGPMPKQAIGSYLHVFVGMDISWYIDPTSGQSPGGFAPHIMQWHNGDIHAVRCVWIDDGFARSESDLLVKSAADMGKNLAHELEHAIGNLHHPAMDSMPLAERRAAVAAGATKAASWADYLLTHGVLP